MRAVVDASIATRWVLHIDGREESRQILFAHQEGRLDLIAPVLQRTEVASAVWKCCHAGLIDRATMETAYGEYLGSSPTLMDSPELSRTALGLAAAHDHSVCDCQYLALSLDQSCELLTADKKLFRSLAGAFPQIRFVGVDRD